MLLHPIDIGSISDIDIYDLLKSRKKDGSAKYSNLKRGWEANLLVSFSFLFEQDFLDIQFLF